MPLLVFAPTAHAATFTWDGGNCPVINCELSTDANWVGDIAPGDGDTLVFPALSTRQVIDNDTTFTYSGVSFTGTPGTCGSDTDWYEMTGSQPLNVSGNLVNDMTGSMCNYVTLNLDVNISGNITIGGDGGLIMGTDNSTTLDIGSSDIMVERTLYVASVLNGGAASSITVPADTDMSLAAANPNFDGQLNLSGPLNTIPGGLGSATGNTVVNDGGSVCYGHNNANTTVPEPFVFNVGTWANYAVFYTLTTCNAGGAGYGTHTDEVTTLSGPITITEDTYLDTEGTLDITGSITGNFNLKLPFGSYGILGLPSGDVTAEQHTVTVASGDNSSGAYVGIKNNETYIINGTRGTVEVFEGGTLKGAGTVDSINVYDGGTLAPGQSPGCINSGNLTFQSGSTYQFEVGGTTACTEYDQTKVTGTVDLGNGTLSLVRYNDFKPVVGQSYTIIDNDSNDAVTGTFNNLAEGATFTVDGYVFKISYVGGDGNDVVVTVQSVPSTPNTGFEILTTNPIVTLLTTSLLAGAIALIARRLRQASAN